MLFLMPLSSVPPLAKGSEERETRREAEEEKQPEPKEGSIAQLVSIVHQGRLDQEEEAGISSRPSEMFELTGQFIFLHRFAPIEIRTGRRISRAERYHDLARTVQQRGTGEAPQILKMEESSDPISVRERLTDPDLKLHQATQEFNYSGDGLKYISSTFSKPPVKNLGGSSPRLLSNFGKTQATTSSMR